MSKISPLAPSPDEARHWAKKYRTQLAASSSTVLSTLVAFPLESVKTRIQSYPRGFYSCVTDTWEKEGLKGFYRGVAAPLISITLVRTLSFSVYQQSKYKTSTMIGNITGREEPLLIVNKPGSVPDLSTAACFGLAGAAAGAASTFIACPFELTKIAMVIGEEMASKAGGPATAGVGQSPSSSGVSGVELERARVSQGGAGQFATTYAGKSTLGTMRTITANCGTLGLYSGFRLQMVRETFGTGVYFMTYESVKQLMVKYQGVDSPVSPGAVAFAGGLCGIVGLTSTYAVDRAKTAYQRDCLKYGRAKSGAIKMFHKVSYQGLSVAAARSALTNAVLFSSFEFLKQRINNLPDPGQRKL